jgi:tetratricopeptide (TPR) repeat protein
MDQLSAIEWLQGIAQGDAQRLGEDHPTALDSLMLLGLEYRRAGQLKLARQCFEKVLSGRSKITSYADLKVLRAATELASVLVDLGKLKEARKIQESALVGAEERSGSTSKEALAAATDLANTYGDLKEYRKEISLRIRNVENARHLYGEHHLTTQMALSGLANVKHKLRDYQGSFDINRLLLQNIPDTEDRQRFALGVKLNVATDLLFLKRRTEAQQVFEEVREVAMSELDPDDWIRKRVEKMNSRFEKHAKIERKVEDKRGSRKS